MDSRIQIDTVAGVNLSQLPDGRNPGFVSPSTISTRDPTPSLSNFESLLPESQKASLEEINGDKVSEDNPRLGSCLSPQYKSVLPFREAVCLNVAAVGQGSNIGSPDSDSKPDIVQKFVGACNPHAIDASIQPSCSMRPPNFALSLAAEASSSEVLEEGRSRGGLRLRNAWESDSTSPRTKLRHAAASFGLKPAIYCRPKVFESSHDSKSHTESDGSKDVDEDSTAETAFSVPCWPADPLAKRLKGCGGRHGEESMFRGRISEGGVRQSVHKVARQKGVSSGRTYTSKYRGVHQTFPTRRWEAQFRRAGKPTSLGCFDREEEAARAYDKMMVWVELHSADMQQTGQMKTGTTNFDVGDYVDDIPDLKTLSQDELVQMLRREGRSQAAANTAAALKARPRISVCAK
mmetsp:Transcript_11111/g.20965  ORF Transcript_11111/g.20965 Transcript_11111/m.20965 type:complete len:405 (+) Transcript_11111:405-1619(+)